MRHEVSPRHRRAVHHRRRPGLRRDDLLLADEPEATAYVIVGDLTYPVDPPTYKSYVRQLERFGGKAALLFDDFNRWFTALWQGKRLGISMSVMSVVAALVLLGIARMSERSRR